MGEKEVDDAVCGVLSPEVVANSEAEVVFGTAGGGALNDIAVWEISGKAIVHCEAASNQQRVNSQDACISPCLVFLLGYNLILNVLHGDQSLVLLLSAICNR